METTRYTIDYFINKFSAIPEELWCTGDFQDGNKFCAQGHCGLKIETRELVWHSPIIVKGPLAEVSALWHLFKNRIYMCPGTVNNGWEYTYQQPTPKQRILAALYDIKAKQEPVQPIEVKERTVYVTVYSAVRELQEKELSEN